MPIYLHLFKTQNKSRVAAHRMKNYEIILHKVQPCGQTSKIDSACVPLSTILPIPRQFTEVAKFAVADESCVVGEEEAEGDQPREATQNKVQDAQKVVLPPHPAVRAKHQELLAAKIVGVVPVLYLKSDHRSCIDWA